jgi:ribose-phosphate pyrophosphokinase
MTAVVFTCSGSDALARAIVEAIGGEHGVLASHRFPDGESYARLDTPVADRHVIIVASLDDPDRKTLPLVFAADAARSLGAKRIGLVAPYLPYTRQDARFKPGEAITSATFARLLSSYVDWLATVDPHLHRRSDLAEIYTTRTRVVSSAPPIAAWVRAAVREPLLIGPDEESRQWVEEIAKLAQAPLEVLRKVRRGDLDVEVSVPNLERWRGRTPVLVDDIIASARTMAKAVVEVRATGAPPPVCIGVHAIFAGDALSTLRSARPSRIVTCNTVAHATNAVDLDRAIAEAVRDDFDHQ